MAFANITAKIRQFKTHIIKKHLQEDYPKASAFLYADYLKQKTVHYDSELFISGAGSGTRTHTPLRITDFELFASHGIQTNSAPYGGR